METESSNFYTAEYWQCEAIAMQKLLCTQMNLILKKELRLWNCRYKLVALIKSHDINIVVSHCGLMYDTSHSERKFLPIRKLSGNCI
jgi:hypothetical protein